MSYLLDTNILLRIISPDDPMHSEAVQAVDTLNANDTRLAIAPQNLIELWNVCTRPVDKNGFGFSLTTTQAEVDRLQRLFTFLPDVRDIYAQWERLVTTYQVKGAKVHDTRLVAFMLVHHISHLLTFNVKDFRRFQEEITALTPQQIIEL